MVETTRSQWLAVSGFRWWWYKITAKFLLDVIQDLRNEISGLNGLIAIERCEHNFATRKIEQLLNATKRENQKLHSQNPMTLALDNVRHAASQQRIRDLELEVDCLRKRLRESLNDGNRFLDPYDH